MSEVAPTTQYGTIRRVLFTWALPGILCIENEAGKRWYVGTEQLGKQIGCDEVNRLHAIAHRGGMTGHWHNC